ncbi:MAG: hypothetical protein HY912_14650 [Desulfomonile tiedjei]|uniref:Uncharacterized protein n=1 Tax=Desulfomonile tiedjei TaxID=2358 RepID=A0A9D6V3C8_9BACT|nr:hypothetical protein [Desulfomonile tiedjei]
MDQREENPRENEFAREDRPLSESEVDCASIHDPVRRALCRVCKAPVIGEAPFCKEHEPPVP